MEAWRGWGWGSYPWGGSTAEQTRRKYPVQQSGEWEHSGKVCAGMELSASQGLLRLPAGALRITLCPGADLAGFLVRIQDRAVQTSYCNYWIIGCFLVSKPHLILAWSRGSWQLYMYGLKQYIHIYVYVCIYMHFINSNMQSHVQT